jgi:hypothetical protein
MPAHEGAAPSDVLQRQQAALPVEGGDIQVAPSGEPGRWAAAHQAADHGRMFADPQIAGEDL